MPESSIVSAEGKPRRLPRWLKGAALGLALLLAAAEAGTRVWLYYFADDEAFAAVCSIEQYEKYGKKLSRFTSHPYLGFSLNPGNRRGGNHVNSQGYRGPEFAMPKPAGEFRIVCMGGSTTYDDEVKDDAQTYPARLQEHLRAAGYNATVVNAGVPGWSSYESVVNYAFRIGYIEPDMLLVNDSWNDLSFRMVYPTEAYASDGTGAKKGPIYSFPFYQRLTCVRLPLLLWGKMQPQLWTALNHLADSMVATRFPNGAAFREMPLGTILEKNKPLFFEKNLKNIVAMATRDGVVPVLLTFSFSRAPAAFRHCFGLNETQEAEYRDLLRGFDEMNASIIKVGRATGAPVYDLAKDYPQSAHWEDLYADGFHNNAAGADAKAKLIVAYLVENKMIPETFKAQR